LQQFNTKQILNTVKTVFNTIRYGRFTCAQELTRWPA